MPARAPLELWNLLAAQRQLSDGAAGMEAASGLWSDGVWDIAAKHNALALDLGVGDMRSCGCPVDRYGTNRLFASLEWPP
jgi:hypothetical protein